MDAKSEPIRVLVADDHPVFRDGIRALLGSVPDIDLVGEAAGGQEVLALAGQLEPDVILMDLQMAGGNGIEATRAILRVAPHIAILVLTMFDDDESIFAAMRAGARGYLLKEADQREILRAIHAVANGEAIFSPGIARRLTSYFAHLRPPAPAVFPELTERERDILALIAQGYDNASIAEQLMLRPKTIRNNISNIFNKLQVADRAQAIVLAREAGYG